MKYQKIHPFDLALTIEDSGLIGTAAKNAMKKVGQVEVRINSHTPYTDHHDLIEFDGVTYLRTTTVEPSERAVKELGGPDWNILCAIRAENEKKFGKTTVEYFPESE